MIPIKPASAGFLAELHDGENQVLGRRRSRKS